MSEKYKKTCKYSNYVEHLLILASTVTGFNFCIRFISLGSSIKYVRNIFRKTNIYDPLIRTRTCACQGVRNVSFSKNFAYVLNGRPLCVLVGITSYTEGLQICAISAGIKKCKPIIKKEEEKA